MVNRLVTFNTKHCQFINVAVAEKLSALRTEDYFRERAARGSVGRAREILGRAGKGVAAGVGDE
ncbi:MAG: hypothetical protein HY821_18365 [Acidobacteria bacterium]|nr:hypothetical protein [Acidobacteriota bacterium]